MRYLSETDLILNVIVWPASTLICVPKPAAIVSEGRGAEKEALNKLKDV
jgi:hypothetical protein